MVRKSTLFFGGAISSGGLEFQLTGRKDVGYFMRGKLNDWSSTIQISSNEELSLLYQVIQNEEYDYIVFATDQDLDGFPYSWFVTRDLFLSTYPTYKG